MTFRLLACLVMLTTLSACDTHIRTPGATIRGQGYEIDIDSRSPQRSGPGHCPPGHAKKGWC